MLANGLDWIGLGLRPEVEYGYQVTMRGGYVAERLRSSIVQRAAMRAIGVGQGSCFAGAFGNGGGPGPGTVVHTSSGVASCREVNRLSVLLSEAEGAGSVRVWCGAISSPLGG